MARDAMIKYYDPVPKGISRAAEFSKGAQQSSPVSVQLVLKVEVRDGSELVVLTESAKSTSSASNEQSYAPSHKGSGVENYTRWKIQSFSWNIYIIFVAGDFSCHEGVGKRATICMLECSQRSKFILQNNSRIVRIQWICETASSLQNKAINPQKFSSLGQSLFYKVLKELGMETK